MDVELSAYDVLMVRRSASAREIHHAYRGLARRFHPDGTEPDASRMVDLNAAYDELKTPDRRLAYERRLGCVTRPGGDPVDYGGTRGPGGLGPLGRRVAAARGSTPVLDFGPYAGMHIADVAVIDSDYLRWLSSQPTGSRVRDAIGRCLTADLRSGRRAAYAR